jgi:hypothetical protein
MQIFKTISHATKHDQWILIHLRKDDKPIPHLPLYSKTHLEAALSKNYKPSVTWRI